MGRPGLWPGRPSLRADRRPDQAAGEVLDLIAIVVDSGRAAAGYDPLDFSPEHRRILGLCQRPSTVADVASDMTLPVGVVRVLLADLIQQGRLTVLPHRPVGEQPSPELLKEILHGLRAL